MANHIEKYSKPVVFLLLAATLAGCNRYYMPVKSNAVTDSQKLSAIDSLYSNNKFFVLRNGADAYYMKNISFSNDKTNLQCVLETLSSDHKMYLTKARKGHMRYKKSIPDERAVLEEVHLYTATGTVASLGDFVLPLNKIQKMEIINKDKGRTTASYVFGGLGIGAGIALVTAIIVAATDHPSPPPPPPPSSSNNSPEITCSPQVYTVNNNEPVLNGALCSGSIFASLKRTDYLPVAASGSEQLDIVLKGAKDEELVMRNFQLIQVVHDTKQKVLIDKNGTVLAYKDPVLPEHAFAGAGIDVVNKITASDEKYYSFTNESGDNNSDIVLDFKKPIGASSAKLIIRGKNSDWAYYVFGEFKKLYGKYYQSLIAKKDKADPAKVLQCQVDQSLPLLVSVKDGDKWKFVDYFFTPGKVALRDMIMQLNLDDFKDKDRLQIRLQTAYMFWDLDYAAMDFSDNTPLSVSYILPSQFYKSGDDLQAYGYADKDTSYLHINGGEQLNMSFNPTNVPGEVKSSYFLKASGYYHDHTIYEQKPQVSQLKKCSGKGAFDQYSRRKFEEALMASHFLQNSLKN